MYYLNRPRFRAAATNRLAEEMMKTYLMADPVRYPTMTTEQIREPILVDDLYQPGTLGQAYVALDRAVLGLVTPLTTPIALGADEALRANYFLERRELGALNIGGNGVIHADGESYTMNNLDCLYIGRGTKEISFESADAKSPAVFYLLSYPAH